MRATEQDERLGWVPRFVRLPGALQVAGCGGDAEMGGGATAGP
jgi:hypothetical protein